MIERMNYPCSINLKRYKRAVLKRCILKCVTFSGWALRFKIDVTLHYFKFCCTTVRGKESKRSLLNICKKLSNHITVGTMNARYVLPWVWDPDTVINYCESGFLSNLLSKSWQLCLLIILRMICQSSFHLTLKGEGPTYDEGQHYIALHYIRPIKGFPNKTYIHM